MPRIFALLFASQLLAQGAQLLTGLLIVRSLSIGDYAVYTVFSLAVSLMALVSDPGMSQILVSVGAKFAGDHARVGSLARAIFRRSLTFMAIAALPMAFYIGSTLSSFSLSSYAIAYFAAVLALQAVLSQMERNALAKRNIFGDLAGYGRTGFYSSNARLIYVAAFAALAAMPWQYAVFSMPIGSLVTIAMLAARERTLYRTSWAAVDNATTKSDMQRTIAVLLPLLPGTAYGVLQGQLPLMLAAGFADVAAVGEFGAVSRVGQIVGIIGVFNSNLLTAHLVRHLNDLGSFKRRIWQVGGLYALYIACVVAGTMAYPNFWFILIGRQYEHLVPLLLPAIITAGAALLTGVLYFATISLERTRFQWLHFVGGAAATLVFSLVRGLPLHTSADIVWFGFSLAIAVAITQLVILVFAIRWQRQPRD